MERITVREHNLFNQRRYCSLRSHFTWFQWDFKQRGYMLCRGWYSHRKKQYHNKKGLFSDPKWNYLIVSSFLIYFEKVIKRDRRKNNFKEYKKMLTGSVEYEYPTKKINSFNGLIKLKKDPKKGVLSIENLILRGTKIRAGWLNF